MAALAHLSTSALMKLPRSAALIGMGSTPWPAKYLCISGVATILVIASLSLATMGAGVLAGATKAIHDTAE